MRIIVAAALALLLAGCSHHDAFISSGVDENVVISKTDPVHVVIPARPTIRERQLVGTFREELCRGGWTLVDTPAQARWVFGFSMDNDERVFGSETSGFMVSGAFFATSRPTTHTTSTARIFAIPASEFQSKEALTVWEGSVSAERTVFQVYQPIIFKGLVDQIGKNYDAPMHPQKPYLRSVRNGKAGGCPPRADRASTTAPISPD